MKRELLSVAGILRTLSICIFLMLHLLGATVCGQSDKNTLPAGAGQGLQSQSLTDPETLRWRSILDALVSESKSISQIDNRAYALAQIADGYWLVDQAVSKQLFIDALKLVDANDSKNEDYTRVKRHIISLAG